METKKLITDFANKYRNYIIYAIATWFVITATVSYMILSSSENINMMMCFGYMKAKFRSMFFFLPDSWFSGIEIKAGVGNFRKLLTIWKSVFAEYGWKLYLYVFTTFISSFLLCAISIYLYFKKQIKKFNDNIIVTGKILPLEEFEQKYPQAFGNYLTFAGLHLSEEIFKTPFYVWGNDESINKNLGEFLKDSRAKKRKVIIFEEKNSLFKSLSTADDILLNPLEKDGVSWDFLEDLQMNKDVMINHLMKSISVKEKRSEIQDLIQYFLGLDMNTKEFFDTLCFAPLKKVESGLKAFTNIEDSKASFIKIRNQIADDLYCFKTLLSKAEEVSFHDYYQSSNKFILWISCGNNVHLKSMIPFMENVLDPNVIKIIVGKSLVKLNANTIVINDTSGDLYYNSSKLMLSGSFDNESLIASFGNKVTLYPSFVGIKYRKDSKKIINPNINAYGFFQYERIDDVLQLDPV